MTIDEKQNIFSLSLPVALGYTTLGITFGILFQELNYGWYWSGLIGLLVYAGAAQFMAIALINAKAGLDEIFLVTLVLNLRHIFYGLSFIKRYSGTGLSKLYLIFSLTDETYSLLTTLPAPKKDKKKEFYLKISALNHFYWVFGCFLGGGFGKLLTIQVKGLDFALTALFIVLAIEQYLSRKHLNLIALSIATSLFLATVLPNHMLIGSISICCLFLFYSGYKNQWKID